MGSMMGSLVCQFSSLVVSSTRFILLMFRGLSVDYLLILQIANGATFVNVDVCMHPRNRSPMLVIEGNLFRIIDISSSILVC